MKYSIKTQGQDKTLKPSVLTVVEACNSEVEFVPTELTITLETKEESVHFHDNVLPHMFTHGGRHDLYGLLFAVAVGVPINSDGEV